MRVEGGTSNVINGVSRQPSEIRLTSQLEESVNQFPTLTRGLVPRNPTKFVGAINMPPKPDSLVHIIDRDEVERYVADINPTIGITVYDLQGKPQTVNAPHGWGYLSGAGREDLVALTVADHTFILNKRKTVQAASTLSPAFLGGGLVQVVQGDYGALYNIVVDNTHAAGVVVPSAHAANSADGDIRAHMAKPRIIAGALLNGGYIVNHQPINLTARLPTSHWHYALIDNVLHIKRHDNGEFHLRVEGGDHTIRAHKDTTPNLSFLPRIAPHNFGIKVTGSSETNYDDYYVKFHQPYHVGTGSWIETVAPSIPDRIDSATMPHILVREMDGSFTFKQADWQPRNCGDLETNPWPSFVGQKIDGMIFFKNRMGFYSGESISLSRNDDYFNFFIESVLTTLDTDPIDVTIAYPDVSDIRYVTPFGSELLLFTSSVPFRLATGGDLLTPKSVFIEPILSLQTSQKVAPVVGGNKLYFVADMASGSIIHELMFDESSGVRQAPSICEHVQGYLPPDIFLMVVDDDLKMLFAVSSQSPETLYVYKWLWVGQESLLPTCFYKQGCALILP